MRVDTSKFHWFSLQHPTNQAPIETERNGYSYYEIAMPHFINPFYPTSTTFGNHFAATSGGPTVNLPPLNFSESQQKLPSNAQNRPSPNPLAQCTQSLEENQQCSLTSKNLKKTKGTKNKTNSKKSIVMKTIPENLFINDEKCDGVKSF